MGGVWYQISADESSKQRCFVDLTDGGLFAVSFIGTVILGAVCAIYWAIPQQYAPLPLLQPRHGKTEAVQRNAAKTPAICINYNTKSCSCKKCQHLSILPGKTPSLILCHSTNRDPFHKSWLLWHTHMLYLFKTVRLLEVFFSQMHWLIIIITCSYSHAYSCISYSTVVLYIGIMEVKDFLP